MIFTWKCPRCKATNESEFKNIRQCRCDKCGFVAVFREDDFIFLSYLYNFDGAEIQEDAEPCKIDVIKNNIEE